MPKIDLSKEQCKYIAELMEDCLVDYIREAPVDLEYTVDMSNAYQTLKKVAEDGKDTDVPTMEEWKKKMMVRFTNIN